ncbi:pseudouridine-5'-phosphate glycosidase [Proteinivorax tanatarense]|uniref:Pseudouridine-5'-phosphate glycosidase n=1 Tax=Proteinivorax tanatarense TaxID=1260629 RepID=A0AAU7VNY2_9FIRM
MNYIEISTEVKEALASKKGVVALESTIISHGMPYPQNLETALEVEQVIRENGSIPATIAIMDGKVKVGLSKDEIQRMAESKNVRKVSRRDIAYTISQKELGATTVSGTMIGAQMAGVKIFATGGIGGVHRDGENTLDISADLTELSKSNVGVVCAGVKSILDIGRTLEYLETLGVPIITYKSSEFPAFFCSKSGFTSHLKADSAEEIANMLQTKWQMDLKGGAVIANPIPTEYDIKEEIIGKAIDDALKECNDNGIKGKDVTPFLLSKIKEITGGDSLKSNIALVKNNARLAANIAKQIAQKED